MKTYFYSSFITALLMLFSLAGRGQSGITTLPLPYTSACAGSAIPISFTSTGVNFSNTSAVAQISDGQSFSNIQTYYYSTNSIVAKFPTNLPDGKIYQVRVVYAGIPTVSSINSVTILIKGGPKPPPPICDSIQYGCQFAEPTQPSTITSYLGVKGLLSDSEVYLYDDNGFNTRWMLSRYIDKMGNKFPYASFSAENVNANPYTKNFYFTQSVDGCESDKATTKLKILPVNKNGIKLIVGTYIQFDASFYGSKLSVCQYDKLDSISTYCVALPAGFAVSYSRITGALYAGGKSVLGSHVPPTDSIGETYYGFRSYAIEPMTYCNPQRYSGPFLRITVKPRPNKPTTTLTLITITKARPPSRFRQRPVTPPLPCAGMAPMPLAVSQPPWPRFRPPINPARLPTP